MGGIKGARITAGCEEHPNGPGWYARRSCGDGAVAMCGAPLTRVVFADERLADFSAIEMAGDGEFVARPSRGEDGQVIHRA